MVGWLLIGLSVILTVVFNPLGEVGGFIYFSGGLSTALSEIGPEYHQSRFSGATMRGL